jgi:hypothetical protein
VVDILKSFLVLTVLLARGVTDVSHGHRKSSDFCLDVSNNAANFIELVGHVAIPVASRVLL